MCLNFLFEICLQLAFTREELANRKPCEELSGDADVAHLAGCKYSVIDITQSLGVTTVAKQGQGMTGALQRLTYEVILQCPKRIRNKYKRQTSQTSQRSQKSQRAKLGQQTLLRVSSG